jgi:hypothetical protein
MICFVQICDDSAFDPDGIEFNSFPTMAKHIVKAILPDRDGEVHKLSLHEGEVHYIELCIYYIFCIFILLLQPWVVINWWISIGLIPW